MILKNYVFDCKYSHLAELFPLYRHTNYKSIYGTGHGTNEDYALHYILNELFFQIKIYPRSISMVTGPLVLHEKSSKIFKRLEIYFPK